MIKVLIDDDILIQLGKQLEAEKKGEKLDCFFSIDEFLAVADRYPKETPIYIDSNLDQEVLRFRFSNIIIYEKVSEIEQ